MPNNYLSVLYKHIIQVENKNVGLKVGGHKHTIAPQSKKWGARAPLPTPVIYIISISVRDQGGGARPLHFAIYSSSSSCCCCCCCMLLLLLSSFIDEILSNISLLLSLLPTVFSSSSGCSCDVSGNNSSTSCSGCGGDSIFSTNSISSYKATQ